MNTLPCSERNQFSLYEASAASRGLTGSDPRPVVLASEGNRRAETGRERSGTVSEKAEPGVMSSAMVSESQRELRYVQRVVFP